MSVIDQEKLKLFRALLHFHERLKASIGLLPTYNYSPGYVQEQYIAGFDKYAARVENIKRELEEIQKELWIDVNNIADEL